MFKTMKSLLISFGCVAFAATVAVAGDGHDHSQHAKDAAPKPADAKPVPAQAAKTVGDPYLLGMCPVSGEALGSMGDAVVKHYNGREVRFCCSNCIPKFEKNQAKYWGDIDAKIIEKQKPFYPAMACPVSGDALGGEMGDPVDVVYNNRLVRLCCKMCKDDFNKDPAKYVAKVDEAIKKAQAATYPLKTCIVSGEPLDASAFEAVYGGRLVRLCCEKCAGKLSAEPLKYMAKLDVPAPKPAPAK